MAVVKSSFRTKVAIAGGLFIIPLILHLSVGGGTNMYVLFSAVVVVFIAGASAVVLMKMFTDEIDLRYLVSEENGQASLSRFQFLFFTFVIAGGYFVVVLSSAQFNYVTLPEIPANVLGLIGISGGSYVLAKGIQKNSETGAGASVTKITVTKGGTGYAAATTKVEIIEGGGKGAVATPTIGTSGEITEIVVSAAGSGYIAVPNVVITDTSGRGSGAEAVASIV